MRQADPDKPVCLVLDDLSVLLSLGVVINEVVGFSRHCQYMMLGECGDEVRGYVCELIIIWS